MTGIRPPRDVAPFVALLGEAATLALVAAYPGIRIGVPKRVVATTPLAQAIGLPAARRLAAEFGGSRLYVPLAKRWRIQHLRVQGLSYTAIARSVGVSEATVHQTLADHGMTRQQMALPL